jgi:hypothetical protein
MVNCGVLYDNTTEHIVGMIYIRIPVPNGSGEIDIAPKMNDQKAMVSLVSRVCATTMKNMIPAI